MAESGILIRPLTEEDWESVRLIYLDGIATGQATFESLAPSWAEWNRAHLPAPRLVATLNEGVIGWAAVSPISARPVYAGVTEVSVYVSKDSRHHGIGKALLETLLKQSESNGIWTLQASVSPENAASIALHKACGFREVGTRERIGCMNGRWRDTMLLERRSKLVGDD
jgi:L-amino acid N-acyltransferase YncA